MKKIALIFVLFLLSVSRLLAQQVPIVQGEEQLQENIFFNPINHASFIIQTEKLSIYVDPVGDIESYNQIPKPDIILVTHTHSDHLNTDVVKHFYQGDTIVIGSKEVIDMLGFGEILNNGQEKIFQGVQIEAVPMYNLAPERLQFHENGMGNGYVVTLENKKVYISGDTEDIPEMRNLKDIDYAFICMNLPYTMAVEQAASAVLEFRPKVVFPYHYRGTDGFSDLAKFKELVSRDRDIEVRLLKWY